MKNSFEFIARAVILKGDTILMCRAKDGGAYFFPGGHIEFGERAEDAIKRELHEELHLTVRHADLIGVVENIYEHGGLHHEINVIFSIILSAYSVEAHEDHIRFEFLQLRSFSEAIVLPSSLHASVLEWIKKRQPFLVFAKPRA